LSANARHCCASGIFLSDFSEPLGRLESIIL
jgi:hypothetical protein